MRRITFCVIDTNKKDIILETIKIGNDSMQSHYQVGLNVIRCLNAIYNINHVCIIGKNLKEKYEQFTNCMEDYICIINGAKQYLFYTEKVF